VVDILKRFWKPLVVGVTVMLLLVIWQPWKEDDGKVSGTNTQTPATSRPVRLNPSGADIIKSSTQETATTKKWPDDPKIALASLREDLSGQKLEIELQRAAQHYMSLGLESAKEFILSLPPGGIGERTLVTAVRYSIPYAPELVGFLKENESTLTDRWVKSALFSLQVTWRGYDMDGALDYFTSSSVLSYDEKYLRIAQMLNMPPAQWGDSDDVLGYINSLPNGRLREDLLNSQGYFRAQIKSGDLAALQSEFVRISELAPPQQKALTETIADSFRYIDDPGPALELLATSNVHGRDEVLFRSYQRWLFEDVNAALTSLARVPAGAPRDRIIASSWKTIADYDPSAARLWIGQIENETDRARILAASDKILNNPNSN